MSEIETRAMARWVRAAPRTEVIVARRAPEVDLRLCERTGRHAGGAGAPQPEAQPESLVARLLRELTAGPMSKPCRARRLGQRSAPVNSNKVVRALLADGSISYTISENPRSQLQKYRLTDAARAAVEGLSDGGGREKSKGSVAST